MVALAGTFSSFNRQSKVLLYDCINVVPAHTDVALLSACLNLNLEVDINKDSTAEKRILSF